MQYRTCKKAEGFSLSYPKLIDATCAAHALHRVYETIRVLCRNAAKSTANGKKIFAKSPIGTELFKNEIPDTPYPKLYQLYLGDLVGSYYAENFGILLVVNEHLTGTMLPLL
jgi:hypothetical protein